MAGRLLPLRALAITSLLLLGAACTRLPAAVPLAAGSSTAETGPVIHPISVRARMMRILEAEWREWGAHLADQTQGALPATARGRINEYDREAFARVAAYWTVLREDVQDYIDFNRGLANQGLFGDGQGHGFPDTPGSPAFCGRHGSSDADNWVWGCQPWSAAFISYVMASAGITRSEFRYADAHVEYVDGLIAEADRWGERAPFFPREVTAYPPRVGDLICADRTRHVRPDGSLVLPDPRTTTLEERRQDIGRGRRRPMHCDIVFQVDLNRRELTAIGGNVSQSVTGSIFALDATGHLLRNARSFFVIFENRIGAQRGGT